MSISNPELLSALASLGLTQYEAKIYAALLVEGVSTAKNISNISGIPYGKIYELLDALSQKGFISVLPSKPRKYKATAFENAINVHKKKKIEELNSAKKLITKILEPIAPKEELSPKEKFWLLNGRSIIYKEIENLFKRAEKKICIYTCYHGLARLENQLKLLKDLKKKGIEINIQTFCKNNNNVKILEKFNQFNITCSERKCGNNVFTIDGKECLMFEAKPDDISPNYGRDFGVWMPNETFTKFVETFFEDHRKLLESGERFRKLLSNASDFIGIVDEKGTASYASSSTKKVIGYDEKELVGKNIFDIVHPADITRVIGIFKETLKKKIGPVIRFRIKCKNGEWKTIEATSSNMLHDPKIKGLIVNARDVTDRKEAEDDLRKSEEKWRSLVENAPDIIIISDKNGTIQFINRTVAGLTIKKAIGTKLYDYIDPKYHKLVKEKTKELFKTGKPQSYEISGTGPNGSKAHYYTRVGPIKQGNKIIAATLIVIDITEKKKIENTLKESGEKFRLLTENASDFNGIIDSKGIVKFASNSYSQLLGYEKGELIGKQVFDLVHPDDINYVAKNFKETVVGKRSPGAYSIFRVRTKNRNWRYVKAQSKNFLNHPAINGVIVNAIDITEKKMLEEELEQKNKELDDLKDKKKKGFLGF